MSRVLLLGRAGAGKTHACLDHLVRALKTGKHALLVVPTYAQAEHLRTLLLDLTGGLGARFVETFTSLSERVARQRLSELVPAPVRDRIAARVLSERFPQAAGQAGFRAEFLRAVKELKEQGEPIEAALEKARTHFPEGSRGRDLFESCALYIAGQPGPDHEDLLLRTRAHLRGHAPELELLLVDGFDDFTPVQRDILDLLAAHAKETVITLPLHPVASRTAASFPSFAVQRLEENRRVSGPLAHLERHLLQPGEPEPQPAAETIQVIACASEEDEADRLARLVVRSGRPYRDFLIVRRSFAGLHPTYRAAFRRHGVPLRFFGREPLGRTPAARAAMLWLRRKSLPVLELLPLLRSPYLQDRPPDRDVDALARRLRRDGEPANLDEFPRIQAALERSDVMPLSIKPALIGRPDGDEDLARAAAFFLALEKELAASTDPEHLLRRIPLLTGAARDRRHECVYAVTADDARQWEKPVVFVAGLTADAFPRQVRQDVFLRDDEREALGRERGLHLPLRKGKESEERYLFYVALTRARERLVLSYPAFDEQGTARAPSPYLDQVQAAFASLDRREVKLSEQFVQPRDAVRRDDLLPIVADGLRHEQPLALSLHDAHAVNHEQLAWPRRLELLRKLPIPDVAFTHLSPSAMRDYERCPFLYMVTKLMRLRRPRAHGLDPLLSGNIAHDALERFVQQGGDAGDLFDGIFTERTAGMRLGIDGEAVRQELRAAVVRTAAALDRGKVLEAERFIDLVVDGVLVKGRIDRVDRCGDGKLIVDYKTGSSANSDRRQLDCYVLAEEGAVGAVFDYVKKDRRDGYVLEGAPVEMRGVEVLSRDEFDERMRETRGAIAAVAQAVRAGRLAVHPAAPENCMRNKCDGYDLCRVARARWLEREARA